MRRLIAALLALAMLANALAMLAAGRWWYGVVPGVTATGPYNPHFVMDIGAAYLMVAGALGWRAAKPAAPQGPLVAAAAFLILHAAIHVVDDAQGGQVGGAFARDLAGVFLPAILAAWLAWPTSRRA